MNSLVRRVDRLEEETFPDAESVQREAELRQAIERARQRVKAADPAHEFPDIGGASPLPGGGFDLVAELERGRRWAQRRALEGTGA
jgi:hypothetical protein